MIIGIDVDGVVVDLYGWLEKRMKNHSKNLFGKKVYFKDGKHVYERYGLNRQQDEEFWEKHIWEYAEKVKPFRDVKKYFNLLKKEGHKLYIVTSRYFAGQDNELGLKMRKLIEKSLYGLNYDKIFYTSESGGKLKVCQDNGIELLIDDSSWNIQDLSPYIKCILFGTKYNKWVKMDNVYRCENWKEIYKYINKLKTEDEIE